MYNVWPLDTLPEELQRPELGLLKKHGYTFDDPREVVELFEHKVAEFTGSPYAVAVDCCSHGLFLSLKYLNAQGTITIPTHTHFLSLHFLAKLTYFFCTVGALKTLFFNLRKNNVSNH